MFLTLWGAGAHTWPVDWEPIPRLLPAIGHRDGPHMGANMATQYAFVTDYGFNTASSPELFSESGSFWVLHAEQGVDGPLNSPQDYRCQISEQWSVNDSLRIKF